MEQEIDNLMKDEKLQEELSIEEEFQALSKRKDELEKSAFEYSEINSKLDACRKKLGYLHKINEHIISKIRDIKLKEYAKELLLFKGSFWKNTYGFDSYEADNFCWIESKENKFRVSFYFSHCFGKFGLKGLISEIEKQTRFKVEEWHINFGYDNVHNARAWIDLYFTESIDNKR
jgi:hypothetical protein